MALKDWRKTPEFRDATGKWISQDFYKGDKFISVWKPAFYSGFRVLIGRNRIAEGRIKKSFNTKAEALKFANEYMKKKLKIPYFFPVKRFKYRGNICFYDGNQ